MSQKSSLAEDEIRDEETFFKKKMQYLNENFSSNKNLLNELNNIGTSSLKSGNSKLAARYFNEAFLKSESTLRIHFNFTNGLCLGREDKYNAAIKFGSIFHSFRIFENAYAWYKQALMMAESENKTLEICNALYNLSNLSRQAGDTKASSEYAIRVCALLRIPKTVNVSFNLIFTLIIERRKYFKGVISLLASELLYLGKGVCFRSGLPLSSIGH